jgi:hypothetical protein
MAIPKFWIQSCSQSYVQLFRHGVTFISRAEREEPRVATQAAYGTTTRVVYHEYVPACKRRPLSSKTGCVASLWEMALLTRVSIVVAQWHANNLKPPHLSRGDYHHHGSSGCT